MNLLSQSTNVPIDVPYNQNQLIGSRYNLTKIRHFRCTIDLVIVKDLNNITHSQNETESRRLNNEE